MYRSTNPEAFNSFLIALKKARTSYEISTLDLQAMLRRLVDESLPECRRIGDLGDAMTEEDKAMLARAAMTIAIYMLILADTRSTSQLSEMALLFLEYSSYTVRASYDFSGLALKAASYRLKDVGFTWASIENAVSADMLAYHFCSHARFDGNDRLTPLSLSGRGCAEISNGIMTLSSCTRWESSSGTLDVDGGNVCVLTRNNRDEKIKASDTSDVIKLDEFSRTFMRSQEASERMSKRPKSIELKIGERYAICITGYEETEDGYFDISCKVLGTDDKVGIVEDEELIKGINTADLLPYMYDGDCIMDAVLIENADVPVFSIRDAYMKFARESADRDSRSNAVLESRVVRIFKGATEDKDRIIWMTSNGYGGLMKNNGHYSEGGKGYVTVRFAQTTYQDLFVNMDEGIIKENTFTTKFIEEDVLFNKFTFSIEDAYRKLDEKAAPKDEQVGLYAFISLGRIMARKKLSSSVERYKAMLTSAWLSNLTGDAENMSYALSRAEYLRCCLAVAQRAQVSPRTEAIRLTDEERDVLRSLTYIDTTDSGMGQEELYRICGQDTVAGQVARFVLANGISRRHPDDVKFDEEQMRRRICELIGVADQYKSSQKKGGGKYGSGELDNVEFKASYVMRNDGKGPDLDYQGRGQVFEAVCGFLNKDGGTVYVGVNNYGDPLTSPGYGIPGDLDWFRENFSAVKTLKSRQMGHFVPQPKDLDSYCLFLNDERDLYFKPTLRDCITISPTEDQDAIRISVKPSLFEIAVLYRDNTWKEGQAFVRDGQETVPMSRVQQEQRLMRLRSVGKVEQFILTLTEAIDRQHKVVLKNYSSSNSNQVKDRFVVPINLVCNNENLWAYDLESRKLREFRLARIESIETELENPSYPHAFEPGKADVFRWINPELNYHVKLKMSIAAYNNLREEYSNTKDLPPTELYQASPERWILDTTLHGWGAVIRFYLGLANQIEILETEDSDELKEEIRRFIDRHLSDL